MNKNAVNRQIVTARKCWHIPATKYVHPDVSDQLDSSTDSLIFKCSLNMLNDLNFNFK